MCDCTHAALYDIEGQGSIALIDNNFMWNLCSKCSPHLYKKLLKMRSFDGKKDV
jgi:hypothetical protein